MSDVWTILLIPKKEDPFGILRRGPFGAQPPTLMNFSSNPTSNKSGRWDCSVHIPDQPGWKSPPEALVLAHERGVVEEGVVWLAMRCPPIVYGNLYGPIFGMLKEGWVYEPLEEVGTVLLLDREGKEIQPRT